MCWEHIQGIQKTHIDHEVYLLAFAFYFKTPTSYVVKTDHLSVNYPIKKGKGPKTVCISYTFAFLPNFGL